MTFLDGFSAALLDDFGRAPSSFSEEGSILRFGVLEEEAERNTTWAAWGLSLLLLFLLFFFLGFGGACEEEVEGRGGMLGVAGIRRLDLREDFLTGGFARGGNSSVSSCFVPVGGLVFGCLAVFVGGVGVFSVGCDVGRDAASSSCSTSGAGFVLRFDFALGFLAFLVSAAAVSAMSSCWLNSSSCLAPAGSMVFGFGFSEVWCLATVGSSCRAFVV